MLHNTCNVPNAVARSRSFCVATAIDVASSHKQRVVLVLTHEPQACLRTEWCQAPLAASEGQCCLMRATEARAPSVAAPGNVKEDLSPMWAALGCQGIQSCQLDPEVHLWAHPLQKVRYAACADS